MERIADFFKKNFILGNRYILWIEILLLIFAIFLIFPNYSLDLKPYGIDRTISYTRPTFKKPFTKSYNKLKFETGGDLVDRRRYIFGFDNSDKIKETELKNISRIIAKRLNHKGDKDVFVDFDSKNKQISVDVSTFVDQQYIEKTVSSSGNFEILKLLSEPTEGDISFIMKDSYEDIGISNKDIKSTARIALEEKKPDDPAARFSIRIKLDEDSNKKVSDGISAGKYFGVFADDEFIGFLQGFSSDKYVISGTNSGDDFYSLYGRLKSGKLKNIPRLTTIESADRIYDLEFLSLLLTQYLFVFAIVSIIFVMTMKYRGFLIVLHTALSVSLSILILKFTGVLLSQYTILGFFFATVMSFLAFMVGNSVIQKRQKYQTYAFYVLMNVLGLSYLSFRFIPGIEATFLTGIMFVSMITAIILLSTNKMLYKKE